MGLTNHGWERGQPQDAGGINEFTKTLESGLVVCLSMEPGMYAGDINWAKTQQIPCINLHKNQQWYYSKRSETSLKQLTPIIASEILRDVMSLAVE